MNNHSERILVTGATGFIGSHLVERLKTEGYSRIRTLALKPPLEKSENNNLKLLNDLGVEIIYGDIRNKQDVKKAVKDIDIIFHLAAISRPMNIPKETYYNTNVLGTTNILNALEKDQINKFIHISTVSVLGVSPDGHPLKENEFQKENQDYGISKKLSEKVIIEYSKKHNFPYVIIRPSLVYGPRCLVRAIMFKFIKHGIFPLIKKGNAHMEFCYIENLIDSIILALKSKKATGHIFNITDGQPYQIKEIIKNVAREYNINKPTIQLNYYLAKILGIFTEKICKMLNVHPPFSRTAADWMSKDTNVYDCTKAKKILKYKPRIGLKDGIKKTIKWYKNHNIIS